jgi:hypothetical protein
VADQPSFHLHDVVRINKPGDSLHGHLGRVWTRRISADNHDARKRWTVDFTPNFGNRATFYEEDLVMVLPLSDSHQDLLEAAQGVRTDERHWTLVEATDRADCGANLAESVLSFFGVQEGSCPAGCEDCQEHAMELGD